jgi:predicted porin
LGGAAGGGCCADLEERVAELEATTARKGNRVVSLQVYGQINKALLIFDDGVSSDAFVADNDQSGSRIGFIGKASFKPGWTAGYNMELDIQDSATNRVSQNDDEGDANEIKIRQNYVYIESDRFGRISLGQQSVATDGIAEIVLGNSLTDSKDIFQAFKVKLRNGNDSGFNVGQFVDNLDGDRDDVIRYDSPSIYGFIVSASWGDNDLADIALRFKKEFGTIRVAAGIGYTWDSTTEGEDKELLNGSFSLMHVPTGLYVSVAGGTVTFENANVDDGSYYYAQLGIEKRVMPYGSTTVYGDYGHYENISLDAALNGLEADRWGFGVVQKFDAAALEVYANVRIYSFDGSGGANTADFEDFSTVLIGSRIKF